MSSIKKTDEGRFELTFNKFSGAFNYKLEATINAVLSFD
jgi:hypothetical protein